MHGIINIVLVETLGEINLGSVARLCHNFGVNELRLVSPKCEPMNNESQKMAVHGRNYLKNAKIFSNLIDAVSDCDCILATSGRLDHGDIPLHSSENALQWLIGMKSKTPSAIIFGREDRGLTNAELQIAHKVINLKTSYAYPSLNLSHAVGIVLHELNSYSKGNHSDNKSKLIRLASSIEMKNFLDDSEKLLLEIGFLHKHTARSRMAKIKGLLQRAETRTEEIALIRGILRQFRWYSKNK